MGPTTRQWRRAALALAAGLVVHLDGISAAAQSSSSSSKSSIVQTKNYIDTISGYTDLSTCAELVLSTVVRGEYSGCADTYALTSYTCFVSYYAPGIHPLPLYPGCLKLGTLSVHPEKEKPPVMVPKGDTLRQSGEENIPPVLVISKWMQGMMNMY